ncbi:MAG TPA: DUF1684 domain-containing protein [Candidatus Limnocylindria bacterium]|jgi:hypothetical protein
MTPDQHRAAVEAWRAARDARLRDPDGWLTLVGLHWLEPGENRFGSGMDNDLVLRGADVPEHAGSLVLADEMVVLRRDGYRDEELAPDVTGEPTMLDLGTLRMHVIRRGDRFGLRVRDHASPALAAFRGMKHFPIDPAWRVSGRLEPAPAGTTLEVVDVIGVVTREPSPGAFAFERDGREWRIQALPGGDKGSLWLVFADATNGRTTYGGGRFLYTDPVADDGNVVADFNLAYNPPCVFTPYATCPLPPAPNRLALSIEAGERKP